ncbi:MAG: cysteine desulfurase NifS [Deltaproteobacteria bacterium]|jgi:cysteine desulfurase|nr:cysteine desulfurase NifS [Deltaproteobacteria bacterium]MBW2535107.1 cysteine desulfurase NifS [Deltaproteobacteria bacterium]
MKTIYVDNNATTQVAPEVYQAMVPFLTDQYFNPSSMYERARGPSDAISAARETIAAMLGGVHPDELLFTSCATESNNTAIQGTAQANPSRRHIITSAVEHPAVLEVCKALERQGYDVTFLPVDERGLIDVADYVRALRDDTLLVSIMHGNNETGVLLPVDEFARIAKETDPAIVVHTDATQTVGKVPIDLTGQFQHVDLLSFSGHKLHAPKGVGALFVRRGTPMSTWQIGGHQERGRRAGTENVAGIVAMAKACELALETMPEEKRIEALRDKLERELCARIPHTKVNGQGAPRLPNTLNLSFHYIEGESILFELDEHGICASSGSACTSGSLEPSHVLMALKVPHTAAHGSVRFSLSRYNTDEEVEYIVDKMPGIVASLRKISPYWDHERGEPRDGPEIKLG